MQKPTILDEIVALKRDEVTSRKAQVSLADLETAIAGQPRPLNMSGALLGDRVRLIGEIKKASPSRGLLCPEFDPSRLASTYVENGAAAISVLTDPRFQGCLEHMSEVKAATLVPRHPPSSARTLCSIPTRCTSPGRGGPIPPC